MIEPICIDLILLNPIGGHCEVMEVDDWCHDDDVVMGDGRRQAEAEG